MMSGKRQSKPMSSRKGKAISLVEPARMKSTTTIHARARNRHAAVNARVRNAAAISPYVECEYQSKGLVTTIRAPAPANGRDAFRFSVQKISSTEPRNERKLR